MGIKRVHHNTLDIMKAKGRERSAQLSEKKKKNTITRSKENAKGENVNYKESPTMSFLREVSKNSTTS